MKSFWGQLLGLPAEARDCLQAPLAALAWFSTPAFETISWYVIEEVFHLQGINATDNIKMEKREESSSDTENECSENHDWIWEKLVIISCYNDRWSSLDLFKIYIRFHINSQDNRLFQAIMIDVTDAEEHEISLQKAVQLAVERDGESITEAVNRCSEN